MTESNGTNIQNYKQYSTNLFPVELVVAEYEKNIEELCESFELPMNELPHAACAITMLAADKSSCDRVVMAAFERGCEETTWVHEAVHVASLFCLIHHITFSSTEDETHAYLTEWAYKCIKSFFTVQG